MDSNTIKNLKSICGIYGTSGDEASVREYIISEISDYADSYKTDNLGNLIVHKSGRKKLSKKVMLAAHMDEVGFIINSINSDGTLEFAAVGGINPDVVIGRQLYFPQKNIYGIVGTKPIHRLTKKERQKKAEFSSLYIDIGAENAKEAEKLISLGDMAYFDDSFKTIGGNKIISKAIDDRAGCLMLIDLIKSELPYDIDFVFTVQEEIGLRGASAAAFSVNPDIAIVFETTTAADLEAAEDGERVCVLGDGAVILYRDRRTMYDRDLYKLAVDTAEKNNIKWQTKTKIAGGNDSGAIQIAADGAKVLALSVPCRYLHSPSTVMQLDDYDSVFELGKCLLGEIENL